MNVKKRAAGLTLLEVVIASVILVAVVAVAMSILFSGTRTATNGQLMSQLEQRGNRTLTFCREQMSTASFTHPTYTNLGIVPGTANTAIGYQVCGPATVTQSGTATLSFGYVDPRIPVNSATQPVNPVLACFLRFEADTVYMESSAAPAAAQAANWTNPALPAYPALPTNDPTQLIVRVLNMDINGNGTRSDTFVSGRLMKYIVDETSGTVVGREKVDDQVILALSGAGAGAFGGDVDLDGQPDLLFAFTDSTGAVNTTLTGATASGLLLNLWHGCVDESGKRFILRNNRQLIHLRTERKNG